MSRFYSLLLLTLLSGECCLAFQPLRVSSSRRSYVSTTTTLKQAGTVFDEDDLFGPVEDKKTPSMAPTYQQGPWVAFWKSVQQSLLQFNKTPLLPPARTTSTTSLQSYAGTLMEPATQVDVEASAEKREAEAEAVKREMDAMKREVEAMKKEVEVVKREMETVKKAASYAKMLSAAPAKKVVVWEEVAAQTKKEQVASTPALLAAPTLDAAPGIPPGVFSIHAPLSEGFQIVQAWAAKEDEPLDTLYYLLRNTQVARFADRSRWGVSEMKRAARDTETMRATAQTTPLLQPKEESAPAETMPAAVQTSLVTKESPPAVVQTLPPMVSTLPPSTLQLYLPPETQELDGVNNYPVPIVVTQRPKEEESEGTTTVVEQKPPRIAPVVRSFTLSYMKPKKYLWTETHGKGMDDKKIHPMVKAKASTTLKP